MALDAQPAEAMEAEAGTGVEAADADAQRAAGTDARTDQLAWNLKFVVREWVPMPLQGELRGFVHETRLTALSQYYCAPPRVHV